MGGSWAILIVSIGAIPLYNYQNALTERRFDPVGVALDSADLSLAEEPPDHFKEAPLGPATMRRCGVEPLPFWLLVSR